jgi:hypothetical protein
MELKVVCQCGQKYKFDVEPVNGRMPFTVSCPVCNLDGTAAANALLNEKRGTQPINLAAISAPPPPPVAATVPPPPPPIAPIAGGLKISRHAPEPAPASTLPPDAPTSDNPAPPPIGAIRPFAVVAAQNPTKKPNFGMGLLGGFVGALVGATVYFLIFKFTGLRIKLLAIGVGALAGWLAELLGKGEGSKELGVITAVLVLTGIVGAQYFVALGWWHENSPEKVAESFYLTSVTEAREAVKTVPTGSDAEIRAYLAKSAGEDGDKVKPADITDDEIKDFRENQLPEYQGLASSQITKDEFEKKHELKTAETQEEKDSDESTFKGVFLLLLLSKTSLFSLAAAAALAFKLCTNA